jgi:hypothetical protein
VGRDMDQVEPIRRSNDVDRSGASFERSRWPDGEEQRMIEATIAAMVPEVVRFGYRAMTFRGFRIAACTVGPKEHGNGVVVHLSIHVRPVQRRIR